MSDQIVERHEVETWLWVVLVLSAALLAGVWLWQVTRVQLTPEEQAVKHMRAVLHSTVRTKYYQAGGVCLAKYGRPKFHETERDGVISFRIMVDFLSSLTDEQLGTLSSGQPIRFSDLSAPQQKALSMWPLPRQSTMTAAQMKVSSIKLNPRIQGFREKRLVFSWSGPETPGKKSTGGMTWDF